MKEMNKVIVKINGSEYPMVGEKSEQHMLNVARYVDEEIKRISEANPKLSTSVLAILSAVNIANELFECGEENDKLSKENEELNKKVGTGEEELKLEMKKLQLSLQGKAKEEEDLKTKIDAGTYRRKCERGAFDRRQIKSGVSGSGRRTFFERSTV